MAQDRRKFHALASLLPAGVVGLSATLAATNAEATASSGSSEKASNSVAERLESIRKSVSGALTEMPDRTEPFVKVDPDQRLAWWGNGWHNGWHNWGNGWHNWGNGWHNGWHNWGNGWHNW